MISVIIPVYRGKELLEKAVRSVQSQSCGDWELILVDDGSPDGCGPVCDRLAGADGRIRVFHQENRGVSRARNLGLSKAAGEYVFFLDADDFIAPETLETLLAALEKSGADTAGCGVRYVDEQGREGIAEPPILPAGVYDHPDILERVVDRLAGDRLSQPPLNGYVVRFLFPRRLLEGLEFQGAYLEDELFLMEYFTRPQRLVTVEDAFYHYYWNPNSATHRYMPGYLDTFHAFLAAKEQVIRERGLRSGALCGGRIPAGRACSSPFPTSSPRGTAIPSGNRKSGCGSWWPCRKWPRPWPGSAQKGWGGTSSWWPICSGGAGLDFWPCSIGQKTGDRGKRVTTAENSVLIRFFLALWRAVTGWYETSGLHRLLVRASAGWSRWFRGSRVMEAVTREGTLPRAWGQSVLCRALRWIVNLPANLLGLLYNKLTGVFEGSAFARLGFAMGVSVPYAIGWLTMGIIAFAYTYWNNMYALAVYVLLTALFILGGMRRKSSGWRWRGWGPTRCSS